MGYDLDELRKVFPDGTVALEEITLTVVPGEHVAFIGPSGAGKTTLFRLLNLTLRPTAGAMRFGGVDVARLSGPVLRRARARIGTIYQQHNLVGRLAVVHNVLAGNLGRWSPVAALASLARPRIAEAERALARVGIAHKVFARTDALSGGQQQRVAIARLLVQDPEVILADEPVSSVDPAMAAGIVALLTMVATESRKTLLVNLHSVDLALQHFPRIVGLRDGTVRFDLPSASVTPDLLAELFAGRSAGPSPQPSLTVEAFGRACRPLAGFGG